MRASNSKDTLLDGHDDEDEDSIALDRTYSIHDDKHDDGGVGDGRSKEYEYDYSREIQLEKMSRQQAQHLQQSASNTSTSAIFKASHRHLMELQIHEKKK